MTTFPAMRAALRGLLLPSILLLAACPSTPQSPLVRLRERVAPATAAMPSIAGAADQGSFEIPLAAELPRHARLETRLGLLPELQRQGARGCFTIAVRESGAERKLVERCIGGPNPDGVIAGWTSLDADVDLPAQGSLR